MWGATTSFQWIDIIFIIDSMNLAGIDLNLLTAFEVLMAERHVTRAARRIGLAQPSMSNALARLRHLFSDPLFVRTREGMQPTARAEALAPHVAAALASVRAALESGQRFDPATARRAFRVAAADYTEFVLLPPLIARLGREAPGIDLRVLPLNAETFAADLDRGRIDAAIGVFPDLPKRLLRRTLLRDDFVLIARRGHPTIITAPDLDALTAPGHILISQRGGDSGAADQALGRVGRERRIALTVAGFQSLPHLVAASDLVAITARRLAERMAGSVPLEVYPLPMPMAGFPLDLVWGQASDTAPAETWFRGVLAEVAADL